MIPGAWFFARSDSGQIWLLQIAPDLVGVSSAENPKDTIGWYCVGRNLDSEPLKVGDFFSCIVSKSGWLQHPRTLEKARVDFIMDPLPFCAADTKAALEYHRARKLVPVEL